jgi:hypothetical protein
MGITGPSSHLPTKCCLACVAEHPVQFDLLHPDATQHRHRRATLRISRATPVANAEPEPGHDDQQAGVGGMPGSSNKDLGRRLPARPVRAPPASHTVAHPWADLEQRPAARVTSNNRVVTASMSPTQPLQLEPSASSPVCGKPGHGLGSRSTEKTGRGPLTLGSRQAPSSKPRRNTRAPCGPLERERSGGPLLEMPASNREATRCRLPGAPGTSLSEAVGG